jgi:enamine deaminase RidA (YjgF/YER057c/UK114 family)
MTSHTAASLQKPSLTDDGFTLRTVAHPEWTEYFLTASADKLSPEKWLSRLAQFLQKTGAALVAVDAFGSADLLMELKKMVPVAAGFDCPWNYLCGQMSAGGGYQAHAITEKKLDPVLLRGRLLGFRFEDSAAAYCFLSDLRPRQIRANPAHQTEEVFELAESALIASGMDFHDVVRTWFYLDRILNWYPEFNRVRTAYFQSRDIFGGIMPASTGVGAANLNGAALLTKVYAMRPKVQGQSLAASPSNTAVLRRVDSPLQCEAYQYGSAFSRAVEVEDAASHSLFISGTASIEPGGNTAHISDVHKQINLTLNVVEAILKSRGMSWADTVRAIGYFRNENVLRETGGNHPLLSTLPVVLTQCDVCRDDLLFEIELQASALR